MRLRKKLLFISIITIFLASCGGENTTAQNNSINNEEPPSEIDTNTEPEATQEEVVPTEVPETQEPEFSWIDAFAPEEPFSRNASTANQQETFNALAENSHPLKDPFRIAYAFGITDSLIEKFENPEPETLAVGTVQEFWVSNSDTLEWKLVPARLEAVTEHAYFWIDTSRTLKEPERLQMAADDFEEIYATAQAVYGSEVSPGVDGDKHIYVMHFAGTAICDVTEETTHQCGLLGYYASIHSLPNSIEEHSNEHEMFVMNVDRGVGGESYNSTLIHEFRHMIENNHNRNTDGWASEGTAVLAQTLIEDYSDPNLRGSRFTANPDLQLNAWTQGDTIPHYGKGYLFSRFINTQIGDEGYSNWVQRAGRGFEAIDETLDELGLEFSARDLWLDWTVAIALIGMENVPAEYGFGDAPLRVDDAKKIAGNKAPMDFEESVRQYAFDIFDVRNSEPVTINFTGSTQTAVLNSVSAISGEYMWFSSRANDTTMTLTREVDLSTVESATLNYSTFYRIEKEWDFAYTLVSTDGGETWEALVGDKMQSTAEGDDPGERSLKDTFYTGRTREWQDESIDLSAYVGQTIQIRFQLVTDLAYTDPGMVIDNISIPEIDFYDDVESLDDGWVAEGFVRVTSYVPQRFHLTLVYINKDGTYTVETQLIADDNTAEISVTFSDLTTRAFFIVAASNDVIMTPALYLVSISK